jgi:Predicted membrane protein (DUF2339)
MLFFLLIFLGITIVLPIVAWVSARRSKERLEELEAIILHQRSELDAITEVVRQIRRAVDGMAAEKAPPSAEPALQAPHVPAPAAPVPPVAAPPQERPHRPVAPPSAVERPVVVTSQPSPPPSRPSADSQPPAQRPAAVKPPPPPPPPTEPPAPASPAFDWESLVGVKLFSAIAGVALVVAAIFFLLYSIEHGWLQPPVRVAIGIVVAIALLVVCEMKAARRYPLTANAMDAAAIAILFATFFSAHALWNLIPAPVAFALLAIVTVVAVLLSIRRESLFIAVLGLLGGFSTPALLSTGENRPIPLFAYLLLLNVGLAWVAYVRRWPALTWLSLGFTFIYQWGWVFKFLHVSSLPLAMAIFVVFPVVAFAGQRLRPRPADGAAGESSVDAAAVASAALPLLFAVYLAGVPAFGARAELLFGFLLLIDLGLLAIALARREELLHAAGATTTAIVTAVWLAVSFEPSRWPLTAIAFTSAFVVLYVMAPLLASRLGRAFDGPALRAQYAGPVLLFVFPVLAVIEPAFANPWLFAVPLMLLVSTIAWRAAATGTGMLYYIAAFIVVAAQATWSAEHLSLERLGTAVALYAAFGALSLIVPIVARRSARALQPAWGNGAVLLVSLGLLLFLSEGNIAPAAIWALALLLAILNAGLFVESAAGRLPIVSQVGSVFSWLILMAWWSRAAGSVGVLPSLTVIVLLTLVTLAGHAWSARVATADASTEEPASFAQGLYIGLAGHLFLGLLATNREWALPPWTLFGALFVITLATSAASLLTPAAARLHGAGTVAAALVVALWSAAVGEPAWGLIVVLAPSAVVAYALASIAIATRVGAVRQAAAAACAVLFVGAGALLLATASGATPPFPALLVGHATYVGIVLALTTAFRWKHVAIAAVAPAWAAILQWQIRGDLAVAWPQLLLLTAALYAVFIAYPVVLGARARDDRDPYYAAVIASAMAFFGAREAFLAGGLDWMIGVVPVVQGAVLALLLRGLLLIQPAGSRDLGRLALVAGAALAFVTVAIPLQLSQQWITIGWALEGAALAWLFRRIPHRGLLYGSVGLLGAVFVRLALNPDVFYYEPRGAMPILNWYLYTYLICAHALLLAAWWLSRTDDRLTGKVRASQLLPAGGVILIFLLLNIEIADFYATGPAIMFRFGVTVSQDLTYTIGWLVFGMGLLAAGIYLQSRAARVAAVGLIAVTTFKCFLYDLGSLEGLHRVASFVGLAISLALVSLALQKFVLSKSETRGVA